jgi:hypothetical protein
MKWDLLSHRILEGGSLDRFEALGLKDIALDLEGFVYERTKSTLGFKG